MKASVYYKEVSNYVEKRYLVRPSIKQVDDKTLSIEYTPHKVIPAISITYELKQCARMLYVCRMNVAKQYLY